MMSHLFNYNWFLYATILTLVIGRLITFKELTKISSILSRVIFFRLVSAGLSGWSTHSKIGRAKERVLLAGTKVR